ncbi:MAG: HAD-IIA family hydrolase [Candidatus Nanohaloarchaea archaeon]
MDVNDYSSFFFDLDRTLWNWDELIIGAADLVDSLREAGKNVYFHTDNTLLNRQEYAKKLTRMGIPAEKQQVLTSAYVAGERLSEKNVTECYVIGEQGLVSEVDDRGIEVNEDSSTVVSGFDRGFNYGKARKAMRIMEEGEAILCGSETYFRTSKGVTPNQGCFNRCLEEFGSTEMVGKPSDKFREVFEDYFDFYPGRSVMIGDRLEDIETGNRLGMTTVAVFSGEIDEEVLKESKEIQRPDFGLSSLAKLKRRVI